jgi:CcmD family protein
MDFLRGIGMIYVVVATVAIVFLGIIVFLFYLERKLSSIENKMKNE